MLPQVFGDDYRFDLFKADVLCEGTDLTVLVTGLPTADTLEAAERLAGEGVSTEVINIHTLKPIDRVTVLSSAHKTGAVLTVENHSVIGGLHSAVLEVLAREKIPVSAVGAPDRFGEVGMLPYLRETFGLTAAHIAEAAKEALTLK